MAYCTNCGAQVDDNAKFCGVCGNKMSVVSQVTKANEKVRKTVYDGSIHKCPNCGAGLASFVKNCPECGYELRGSDGVESVSNFAQRYAAVSSNDKKVDLIRTFAIPNTKEDILEFVILASSNIDTTAYTRDEVIVSGGASQQDVSDAWMAKFEQAYQKATILLSDSPELKRIEKLYEDKKSMLEAGRKTGNRKSIWNNNKKWIGIVATVLAFVSIYVLLFWYIDSDKREFTKQLAEVQECIDLGDYDKALTLAYSMNTSYSSDYEKTQADLISRILELKGALEGNSKIPNTDYEDKQYEDIVKLFQKAGFTNVIAEKVPDLITGWIHKEGEVIEVSIDGSTSFTKGEYCDSSVEVIVRYHGYSD